MNDQSNDSQQARLAALYEVSSRLGTSLDLSEVLNQVMDAIIQLTGAERGFLMLFDPASNDLQTVAARNVDQKTIDSHSRKISRTVVERAISTGEGVLTNNAQEDERFSGQQSVVGYQLRSIMCAPLRARNQILGAVYVDNRLMSGVFSKDDIDLLVTFTNQAAIAIDNARLFTQTDQALARRVEELSLFQQIDQQLNKALDLNRVLSLALDWAISHTEADGGSIGLLEEVEDSDGEQVLRLQVYKGPQNLEDLSVVPTTHPVLAEVMVKDDVVTTLDITSETAIDNHPGAAQIAVPIRNDGVITGLIVLKNQEENTLTAEDIDFVKRLSDRAAVAIKNSRLYEDIQALNQAKSDFISIVTHELRLPMTSIKGYTDLLLSGMTGPLTDQQQQFLEVVKRNLGRMSDLIRDLSEINHLDTGRMTFEKRDFDFDAAIEEVVDSWTERITSRGQTLTIEKADDIPPVYADPKRVGQVLSNLVSNAHKYTPDDGKITIRLTPIDANLQVEVIDTGLGISEENQVKLFTQFFRAEDEAVREQAGWGLGLSIVKRMVEAQSGEIWFESVYGEGSTFAFTVPLAK